jgi:hypothetical protein
MDFARIRDRETCTRHITISRIHYLVPLIVTIHSFHQGSEFGMKEKKRT